MPMTQLSLTRMLVVSREPSALRPLWSIGRNNAWHLETAENGWDALERLQSGAQPDLLVLDCSRGASDTLHTLRWLRRVRPELPIVMISHPEDAALKSEAMRLGAQEYLVGPLREEALEEVLKRHVAVGGVYHSNEYLSQEAEMVGEDMFFIAAGPAARKLRTQAELLAQLNVPVLILGESGTGKETTARLIHKLSSRAGHHFVKVNCAALPSDVLENELFGHEAGSFGSSARPRAGKFEACEKGTILLEEITEMPLSLQGRMLRVLQDKQFFRQGHESAIDVDVRVLASSSVSLEQALEEKKLRDDLYYQLSAFIVHVPPLRQRRDEIPVLLECFVRRLARHYALPERSFSPAALEACQAYSWPGNLRELENIAKRHLVIGEQELTLGELERAGVFADIEPQVDSAHSGNGETSLKSFVQSVKGEAEKNAIAAALDKTRWNRKAAARLLKVSYRTLLYKIDQYHMSPPNYPSGFATEPGMKGNGRGL